jgi:N-acetylmuramoyl-L-alanine amidase
MKFAEKNFHKVFASVSLGIALLLSGVLPRPCFANSANNSSVKRDAASAQFGRAEELRETLNTKPAEKRTLAEYKQVVNSYRRVYLITAHAVQVPDALVAIAELNTEMGDRFGRSYYQAAVDAYQFLMREYPTSKYIPDLMFSMARLQKNQLGDAAGATQTFLDYQKKYPHSPKKREVQEELAELALVRNAESGTMDAKVNGPAATAASRPVASSSADIPEGANPRSVARTALGSNVAQNTNSDTARLSGKNGGEDAASGSVPHVNRIKTSASPNSAEIVIELEDSVQYSSGRIANPDRIYFDLHAARLSPSVAHGNVAVSGGMLTRVRVAQNQFGIVRVVLDVNGVQDYAATLVKKPTRLVIELYGGAAPVKQNPLQTAAVVPAPKPNTQATEPRAEAQMSASAAATVTSESNSTSLQPANAAKDISPAADANSKMVASAPKKTEQQKLADPSSGSLTHPKSGKNGKQPDLVQPSTIPQLTRDGQSTLTRALGLKIGRIVIDAGHGGHDTGTIGPTGLMEKDLCLDVALRLGKLIQQRLPDTEIVYTRSDDTFIPLEERTHIANDLKADLFISIHANSSPDHLARGVETYYLNLRGSAEAMEVAARENAVSQGSIHDLEDMVKKIARTEKIDESKELAEDIQDSLSKRIQKTAKPVKNRGVRKAPFVVLIGADMPSILTEISFLSNPSDEQLLKKPEHRQRIAEGVFTGVTSYLESLNSMNVKNTGRAPKPAVVSAAEQSRSSN